MPALISRNPTQRPEGYTDDKTNRKQTYYAKTGVMKYSPTTGLSYRLIQIVPFQMGTGVLHMLLAIILGGLIVELNYSTYGWILVVGEAVVGFCGLVAVPFISHFYADDDTMAGMPAMMAVERRMHVANTVYLIGSAILIIFSLISFIVYAAENIVYSEQFLGISFSLFSLFMAVFQSWYVFSSDPAGKKDAKGESAQVLYENIPANGYDSSSNDPIYANYSN